jgi:hypothetical protein
LNHLSTYFYENASVFAKFYPTSCSLIVSGLACANYKPPLWNELQDLFTNYMREDDNTLLCSFAIDLATLDYYNPNILRKVFTNCNTLKILSQKSYRFLYKLYYSVKILYPEYDGPWPSNETLKLLNTWKNQQDKSNNAAELESPLLSTLEELLGCSTYIKTNVKIKEVEESIGNYLKIHKIFRNKNLF